jgi:cellulose synthase/poly-beta-1,6-N-acetylglucosamine synthase-like glycosyltransferase
LLKSLNGTIGDDENGHAATSILMAILLALILAPLAFLTLCFAVEVLAGLRAIPHDIVGGEPAKAIVIVPAHDEAAILEGKLSALKEAADGLASILLVADNCTDETAAIGRRLGVEVVERQDATRRGKGFALDFGRRHLDRRPPNIVVIIDADATIDRTSLRTLIAACSATGRPCQATNLQKPQADGPPTVQLSTFAFFLKNVIRQRGLQRLAGRAHLLGTGMALPWRAFADADLATDDIVEDLKLGNELAEHGHPPLFIEQAVVLSEAETRTNTLSQRRRWEGGFIANAVHFGPRLFWASVIAGDVRRLWAAINIMIPPFALLLSMDLVLLMLAGAICWLAGAAGWPLLILLLPLTLAATAIVLAWSAGGWRYVTIGGLARAPLYVAWKIPMYLGFARHGTPKQWVRTGRQDV